MRASLRMLSEVLAQNGVGATFLGTFDLDVLAVRREMRSQELSLACQAAACRSMRALDDKFIDELHIYGWVT